MMFGQNDLLSLWVADMDFAVSEPIQQALQERLNHPVFGYNLRLDDFYAAVINWQQQRFNWEINRDWIVAVPGVVPGIALSILSLTNPGDGVLIQTPVYQPFFDSIRDFNRKLLTSPLINMNGVYSIDWADFEANLKQAKLFILCNPHNPVSRVWTKEELIRMGKLCQKHKVLIFSDEIHADIVYPGFEHSPIANLEDFAPLCITGVSPSKSFNIAGLSTAVLIISNPELRNKVNSLNFKLHLYLGNSFGIVAFIAAYRDSRDWLSELMGYLDGNRTLLTNFIHKETPNIVVSPIESTFLAWLDFRAWDLTQQELIDAFVKKAKLALEPGEKFGIDGQGFMRLNFACPRSILLEALDRIKLLNKDLCQ